MNTGFLDKFLERLDRVGPGEVQAFLLRLAQEKGFLESIFDSIQEGIIVTDPRARIIYVNRAACAFFALDRELATSAPIQDTIRGVDWKELLTGEAVVNREMEVFYPQDRFLNFYVTPLGQAANAKPPESKPQTRSGKDEPAAHVIILRDITESRRRNEETIESEQLSALTMLAAGVAHEIGNPLNSLNIHLQLMERSARKLPAKAREEFSESIGVAREEIKRLDHIITQFLRAIRPSVLETVPENLNSIVAESVDFLAKEIKDRDILVEQELRSDLPLLELDRAQIKQAIYNLIRNAFQAMQTGGILRIHTDLDHDGSVLLSFADTGGGIPESSMPNLFQPYFTTKKSGTGLGLLVVRRIVREHGGELAIASDKGKGVTVTIRLPLRDRRIRLLGDGIRPSET